MYQLTGENSLSKNNKPRATRKEALRIDEETGKPYIDYSQHIDKERTSWNKVLVNRDVKTVYQEHVGEAVAAYNAKQLAEGRSDRLKTVEGYMAQIVQGESAGNSKSRPRLWNDITTQIGNMDSNEAWVIDKKGKKAQPFLAVISNEVYAEFVKQFEARYPNLVVTLAVVHNDESTPHLQLHYVPFCHKNKRGLSTQVKLCDALADALDRVGVPYGRKREDNVKQAFNADLDQMLESIMLSHGIQRIPGEKKEIGEEKRNHESMVEYRKRLRILRHDIANMMKENKNPLKELKGISVPFKGIYYSESEVRGVVKELQKQNAMLQETVKTLEAIEHKNSVGLKEQRKRMEYEMRQREINIDKKEKEVATALNDVLTLKEKLQDSDEQRKYKLLTAEVKKEKKALKAKLADSDAVVCSARQDAIRIRDAARKDAAEYVADAQHEVDALYAEYASSVAGRRKKDIIKLQMLAEKYPEISDHLDSAAGHAVLRGRRPTDRGNARTR